MAGFGLDAKMLSNTDEELKAKVGWLAYVDAIRKALRDENRMRMRYRVDRHGTHRVSAHTLIIGNCGSLPANILLLPTAAIDDGRFEAVFLRPESAWGWIQILVKVIWENGVLRRTRWGRTLAVREVDAVRYVRGQRMDVVLSHPEEVELDGDTFGRAEAFRTWIDPGALTVRVPAGEERADRTVTDAAASAGPGPDAATAFSARRERGVEDRPRPARHGATLLDIRAGEHVGEHGDREQHVLGLDVVADAPGGAFACEHGARDGAEPGAQVRHVLVVPVRPDEVDERGRDDRLLDDRVEQVVERGIRGLDGCLELVDVLVEHGHGERESIGEVPVEAALPDARLLRDGAERRLQPVGGEDLARGRDERAAIRGAGGRPAVGLRGPRNSLPTFRHGCYLTTGQRCPV